MDIEKWTVEFLTERCSKEPSVMAELLLKIRAEREEWECRFNEIEKDIKLLREDNCTLHEDNRTLKEKVDSSFLRYDEIHLVKKLVIAIHDAKWEVHDINPVYFNTDISGMLHNLTQHRNIASHYEDNRDEKKTKKKPTQEIRPSSSMKFLLDQLLKTEVTQTVRNQVWGLCRKGKYAVDDTHSNPNPIDAMIQALSVRYSTFVIPPAEQSILEKKWQLLSFNIPFLDDNEVRTVP